MTKYRKKPVVVEAFQMTEYYYYRDAFWPDWLIPYLDGKGKCKISVYTTYPTKEDEKRHIWLRTLEGNMSLNINSWVVKGVDDEIHPVKPDIFEKTYEKVQIVESVDTDPEIAKTINEKIWNIM